MVGASISQDLLVVSSFKGLFKFYSLSWVLKNCVILDAALGEMVEIPNPAGVVPTVGVVGEEGFGLPYTVEISGKE